MQNRRVAFLGIDIGTTAVKAVLVDIEGKIFAECDIEQTVLRSNIVWVEQDPVMWWENTLTAISKVVKLAKNSKYQIEVIGIGLTGQMHSSVLLDEKFEIVRPAILWSDGRTTLQCQEISEKIGLQRLKRFLGNRPVEGLTAPKLLWLKQNEPRNFERLKTLLLPKDYVRYRMTGIVVTDHSDASATLLYDIYRKSWSADVLDILELPHSILPDIIESVESAGTLQENVADMCGLQKGIPVICGGADNPVGAVASGVFQQGLIQSSIGTSGTLLMPTDTLNVDKELNLHNFVHCKEDWWYQMGVILSAGDSLKWLRNILYGEKSKTSYDSMIKEAESILPGSDGLIFLPHLVGERTPHNDSNARGVFIGLHAQHTRAHLVRAVMEGVCFALRDSLEIAKEQNHPFTEIRAVGSGSLSKLWRQIQADVFNLPVTVVNQFAGPAYGAAILAAVGQKSFSSINEVVELWTNFETSSEPNSDVVSNYDKYYSVYRNIYPSVKASFQEINSLTN